MLGAYGNNFIQGILKQRKNIDFDLNASSVISMLRTICCIAFLLILLTSPASPSVDISFTVQIMLC